MLSTNFLLWFLFFFSQWIYTLYQRGYIAHCNEMYCHSSTYYKQFELHPFTNTDDLASCAAYAICWVYNLAVQCIYYSHKTGAMIIKGILFFINNEFSFFFLSLYQWYILRFLLFQQSILVTITLDQLKIHDYHTWLPILYSPFTYYQFDVQN